MSNIRSIGILTAGGDCPGLNAAIRAVAKAAMGANGMRVVGILDGFRGLVENRSIELDDKAVSGILTQGGTMLGTSRDKPHKMPMGDRVMDMVDIAVANAARMNIDALVCLGGNGTQKNARRIHRAGLPVVTLPKTIDNDVAKTDITFGFDTALGIATEAIDRLHTTATSHHRMIVVEIMGHKAGWLALGSGIAGGADVILIPERPYDLDAVAEHLRERRRHGKRFSIIGVAEGAHRQGEIPEDDEGPLAVVPPNGKKSKKDQKNKGDEPEEIRGASIGHYHVVRESKASRLARDLQALTGTEARVTALGHVQRGGSPSATDRLLCSRLGTTAADLLASGQTGVMVALHGEHCQAVPLDEVAGKTKLVPKDHPLLACAQQVGSCLG
jgi:ATP-dependent phosphofructokinase / diphosphate-dependent phosphofructokinase